MKRVPFYELMTAYVPKYSENNKIADAFIEKGGRVQIERIERSYDEARPYRTLYLLFHGYESFASVAPDMWNPEWQEDVYKKALDEGKTWEEVVGFKGYKKGSVY